MNNALENYSSFYSDQTSRVGIYLRLSREDEEKDNANSESILNQKELLTKYVADQGWNLVEIYADDGYSGTNFNRPDFKRMIADIENKRINTVITKDLSRLGRDYIVTGHYLEKYFPERKIRFIALLDGIDTYAGDSPSNDIGPFKSIMNDWYAKDISKKVRSVIDRKRENGEFIGSFAPYGYYKDPNDKHKLKINEETSAVVRRIFDLFLQGKSYSAIAGILNSEHILSPAVYKSNKTNYRNPKSHLGMWNCDTIKYILTKPTYCGNITQRRCLKVNYKVDKLINMPRQAWVVVPNTHEAIVVRETFELVQQMIRNNGRMIEYEKRYPHMLSGLLYCADCGEKMTYTQTPSGYGYVICSKYKRYKKQKVCTRHAILEKDLESLVISDLIRISRVSLDQGRLAGITEKYSNKNSSKRFDNDISSASDRLAEIKRIIKNLYEDKLKGVIAEQDFINLSKEYNEEREQLNTRLLKLSDKKRKHNELAKDSEGCWKLALELLRLDAPDKILLRKLIDRIDIYENKKVEIHYKFKAPEF